MSTQLKGLFFKRQEKQFFKNKYNKYTLLPNKLELHALYFYIIYTYINIYNNTITCITPLCFV